ncbi:MAG: hypothetical protein FVQ83_11080 [Chloroflexi bacterium]|nr:hypothetical protein [Chloroflexota bacterium]
MKKTGRDYWSFRQQIIPWLTFLSIALFTYAHFFARPYKGFSYSNGRILRIYVPENLYAGLKTNDNIIQIGTVTWEYFAENMTQQFFVGVQSGDVVPIQVQRGEEIVSIDWVFPGLNANDFYNSRLGTQWFLPYIFWAAGTATYLLVRPRDNRWRLFAAFNYITAFWLAAGSGPSVDHVFGAAIALRSAIWLSVPIYLHLHWVFPKRLSKLPRAVWWFVYSGGIIFAVAQIFQVIPPDLYFSGFLLALIGSVILIFLHYLLQKEERNEILLITRATLIAFIPPVLIGFVSDPSLSTSYLLVGSMLAFPLIPGTYFYTLFRRQLGDMELRANRFISIYLFIILLGSGLLIIILLVHTIIDFPMGSAIISIAIAIPTAIFAIAAFARFQRFVESRILGIPLPPTHLASSYASHITSSLEIPSLIGVLRDQVLPSMLIRQSALLAFEEGQASTLIFFSGIEKDQIPPDEAIPDLLEQAFHYRAPQLDAPGTQSFPWIRLALPLRSGEDLIGIWLLGKRDPDDIYYQAEISILASIASQTAIAIANIFQAKRLRTLFQANIDRHESERARLARDLHDEVLNQLGAMFVTLDESSSADEIEENYQILTDHLRQIIQDLRPAMLTYGLYSALNELTDNLMDRSGKNTELKLEISKNNARLEPNVELHIFRIVQQACENALRYVGSKIDSHLRPY